MATPPAFAPQRYASPTMRHASPSSVSPSHFSRHQASHFRRKARQAFRGKPEQEEEEITPTKPLADNVLGMSFEEVPFSMAPLSNANPPDDASIFRTQSVASVATSASLDSSMTGQSGGTGDSARRSSFAPSMCTSSSSFVITPLATPASSRAPSMIQTDASMESSLPSPIEAYSDEIPDTPAVKGSWVPNFGKMAKAVVHHSMNMSPFGEKKSRKISGAVKIVPADAVFAPAVHIPQPTQEELQRLDDEAAMARRREWAFEQQQRVQECARLCSQWPQSGYNQMKWGPYGSKHFYEPQSYCNPQHVATVMQRQAELERKMCEESALFFSCRRASSDSSSAESSSAPSPTISSARSSECLSADLSAAMSDSLISKDASPLDRVMSGKRSLSDLKSLSMDIDQDSVTATRPGRAQSCCGFKRPLTSTPVSEEEDKRRRVDEQMVVEEAVETGVIQPAKPFAPPVLGGRQLSASTPNLNANDSPAMFGHVVKTSDTHPIIISPFFPEDLLKVVSQNVTVPQQYRVTPSTASVLVSSVDVPSLLLSAMPPQVQGQASMVPPPVAALGPSTARVHIGNLLLSSCPGKRLRMEGPVKGRGPVCRDLETDLRRIKNEGVGCLVCCLDDSELALLGVPWENYSAVAGSIGLDVVRLPMPDGFTPVSLSLFDAQINLIATKYSLQGINVLVHCRGGVGRAGLTASAWAIKMGFVTPHPSLTTVAESAFSQLPLSELASRIDAPGLYLPAELDHQICMSMVERVIAMIRSRRGLKAIESFEQVQFLAAYVKWLRAGGRV